MQVTHGASGVQGADLQTLPQEGNESGCVRWPMHTSFRARTHAGTSQMAATGDRPIASCQDRKGIGTLAPLSPPLAFSGFPITAFTVTQEGDKPLGGLSSALHSKISPVTMHSVRSTL